MLNGKLNPLVTDQTALIARLAAQIEFMQNEVVVLRTERDLYKERYLTQQRRLFAAKSEQRSVEQRDLFFNEAEASSLPVYLEAPSIQVPAHQRVKRGRKPIDPALPREVIRYELPL